MGLHRFSKLPLWASLAAVLFAALLVPTPAPAQTDQARVVGAVIDQSGAFVPGATVTLRNERTGEERKVVVGEDGRYVFAALKPSTYTLRATKDGFAPLEYTGLQQILDGDSSHGHPPRVG